MVGLGQAFVSTLGLALGARQLGGRSNLAEGEKQQHLAAVLGSDPQ